MIDTHAHLNVENFNHKIHETLDFALKQGVSKIIVIGMDQVSNQKSNRSCSKTSTTLCECWLSSGVFRSGA